MKIFSPLLFMACATALSLQTQAASQCKTATEPEIAALFERWNTSLQTGDARQVAANYAPDAVLLPTASSKPRLDDAARIDYFEHFLKNRPVGKIDTRTVRVGCNEAIDTGTYTFTFADNSTIPARYTFTYEWFDSKWLITSHHSSKMPEQ